MKADEQRRKIVFDLGFTTILCLEITWAVLVVSLALNLQSLLIISSLMTDQFSTRGTVDVPFKNIDVTVLICQYCLWAILGNTETV